MAMALAYKGSNTLKSPVLVEERMKQVTLFLHEISSSGLPWFNELCLDRGRGMFLPIPAVYPLACV